MDTKTAAGMLGMTKSALYRAIRKAKVKAVKVKGRWAVISIIKN